MWGYVLLLSGMIIFLIDLYFIYLSLGFQKKHCKKCKGYLKSTKQHKDIYVGGKSGRFYKHFLDYVYVYRVNGKEYTISGGVPGVKSNIQREVDIIFQKRNPKLAYIHRLTSPIQPIVAFLLSPLCIMLVLCGVFVI